MSMLCLDIFDRPRACKLGDVIASEASSTRCAGASLGTHGRLSELHTGWQDAAHHEENLEGESVGAPLFDLLFFIW